MGYYDRDNPNQPIYVENRRMDLSGAVTTVSQLFVRTAGIIALLVGLWSGVKLVSEAWVLYDEPSRIERFALAIEKGSNIDGFLNPTDSQASGNGDASTGGDSAAATSDFRLSYFAAWAIVLCLLLVVGRIAVWAIKTGGELALYDTDLKRFTRNLVQQAVRGERR